MKVLFDPLGSWTIVTLLAVATLAIVVATYRRQAASLSPGYRRMLLGFRIAAWLLLLFVLVRPSLEFSKLDRKASVFAILTDRSRSMGVPDGPGGITRRESLLRTLEDAKTALQGLAKEVEVLNYDYDAELSPVEKRTSETPGEQTAQGNCLEDLLKVVESRRLAGLLMMGDGGQRALSPRNLDPRIAAQRYADLQIPIDTVPYGMSGFTDQSFDLAIEDLQVNPTVFVKNTLVVRANLRAVGLAGKKVMVRVLFEDRRGSKPVMASVTAKELHPKSNLEVIPCEFTMIPDQPGEFRLEVKAEPLPGEARTVNNSLTTFITVLKGGISVALFDTRRFEVKFIQLANDSPEIRIDQQLFRAELPGRPSLSAPPIDPKFFEPGKYDVYMFGDVPAKVFSRDQLRKIANLVDKGAGLMMYGGLNNFGAGGYAETALADVLPVTMSPREKSREGEIDPTLHAPGPLHMVPTAAGLREFVMRLDDPAKNAARWASLAALEGANRFTLKRGIERVLAQSQEGQLPMLVSQDYGRGRVLAFAGDTTYQWVLAGQQEEHQRFWQQAILWLARKDQLGDESVWIHMDGRRFRAGQAVPFTYGARNSVKQPLTDVDFSLEIAGPDKFREQITGTTGLPENVAKFANARRPGEYRITATGSRKGVPFGVPAQARFIVYENDLELNNPAADVGLLEEISRITMGQVVAPEKLPEFVSELIRKGRLRLEVEKISTIPLWDNAYVIALYALLLTCEWFLRKRRGLA